MSGCGGTSPRDNAAFVASQCGCSTICDTGQITVGDTLNPVPEFAIAVADEQLVEVTITGYVIKTINNVSGLEEGYIYYRGMARRYDADASFPGLAVLSEDFTLQLVPAGIGIVTSVAGNVWSFFLQSAAGTWRWDLTMVQCIRDQIIDTVVA